MLVAFNWHYYCSGNLIYVEELSKLSSLLTNKTRNRKTGVLEVFVHSALRLFGHLLGRQNTPLKAGSVP